MNMDRFEMKLRAHSARVKNSMAAPFDQEMEELYMKNSKTSYKKVISIIAAAAALACLATAFAAGGLGGWYSSPTREFESIHDSAPIAEELGYAPVLIESFKNGYSYKTGYSTDNEITDDDGSVKESFKSAFFTYEKDGDEVWFSQDRSDSVNVEKGEIVATVDGIDVYYYSYTNKIVPEDYEMTEEDKAAEESGELIFSWGSDTVKMTEVCSAQWKDEGIAYCLMQMGGKLSAEELTEMAIEAIEAR